MQMSELEINNILRGNLIDAREDLTDAVGEKDFWFFTEQVSYLQNLLLFGTLEEKTKIANP